MHPVLFDLHLGPLGQVTIGTYGLFYAAGFLAALRLAVFYARREGIESARIVDLGIITLLAGFVGAKLLLYMLDFRLYLANPMEIIRGLRSAGVFYGGFALASAAALVYVRRHRLPLGRVADLMSPPLALGQAIGRLGCFAAGCCFGKACSLPWAVTFTDPRAYELTGVTLGMPLHPTQIYHALSDLLLLAVTAALMRRKRFDGQVFWVYVLGYAVLRFIVEFFRGDTVRGLFFDARVSTSQLIALPTALLAAVILYYLHRRAARAGEPRSRHAGAR